MSNSWFRLYAEFANDPKVQMLSEADQRRLILVFCLRCNGHVTLQDESVAFQLRISNEEWARSKALFVTRGFLNEDNSVCNWDKRQFVSDSSAARVAKHREAKKHECNVTVTPPDTDTDTDTEHKKQTPLSGSPDVTHGNGKEKMSTACLEILDFLNTKTGRHYKPVDANIQPIANRIREGATVVEIRQVIAKKCREWGTDDKMRGFLRPLTLFNKSKFAQYQGELGESNVGQ